MGFFRRKRNTGALPARLLNDDGEVFVVGESNYQAALEDICGPKCEDGYEEQVIALLMPEPENPYDRNAVRVQIEQRRVGYLSRDHARLYLPVVQRVMSDGSVAACVAYIRGGWRREHGDYGHFGVVLRLAPPDEALLDASDESEEFFSWWCNER